MLLFTTSPHLHAASSPSATSPSAAISLLHGKKLTPSSHSPSSSLSLPAFSSFATPPTPQPQPATPYRLALLIPDFEGDLDHDNPDVDMFVVDITIVKELDKMKRRLKEMKEEAVALRPGFM